MNYQLIRKKYEDYAPYVALLCISLGGLWIRALGAKDFYYNPDEMQFLIIAKGETLQEVWRRGLAELHPPLAHFIRHYLLEITPEVYYQRLFSISAAVLSIIGIYRLGLQLKGQFIGLFCAICMAFVPVSVSVTMTIRNYAFFMAFMTWALYYYSVYQSQEKRADLVRFTILIFLASATHFTGFLVAAACGITEGWRLLANKRRDDFLLLSISFIPLIGLGLFLYLHFLAPGTAGPMWHHLAVEAGYVPKDFSERTASTFLAFIISFCYFQPFFNSHEELSSFDAFTLTFGTLLFFIVYIKGLILIFRYNFLLGLLITSIWIIAIISSMTAYYPFTSGRHNYYLLPFMILPIGFELEKIGQLINHKIFISVISIVLIAAIIFFEKYDTYLKYEKDFTLNKKNFYLVSSFLNKRLQPKDIIVTERFSYFYFLNNKDQGKTPYDGYGDIIYNNTTLISPINPPYNPHTLNSSWKSFHGNLNSRINSDITAQNNNVWFVMYGWKNREIEYMIKCKPIQSKIQNYFTLDGVLVFSLNNKVLSDILKDNAIWDSCYSSYKPLLHAELFDAYPALTQIDAVSVNNK